MLNYNYVCLKRNYYAHFQLYIFILGLHYSSFAWLKTLLNNRTLLLWRIYRKLSVHHWISRAFFSGANLQWNWSIQQDMEISGALCSVGQLETMQGVIVQAGTATMMMMILDETSNRDLFYINVPYNRKKPKTLEKRTYY